jgi:predicted transcriptional regulator with HTH domain
MEDLQIHDSSLTDRSSNEDLNSSSHAETEADHAAMVTGLKNDGIETNRNKRKRKIMGPVWDHLFDFVMLFLAVFCGFMADNWRERLSENQREKIFINSIVEDIRSDTLESNAVLEKLKQRYNGIDSVIVELMSPGVMENSNKFYRLWTENLGLDIFVSNDRTIKQLKSSGELRLIRNREVSDRIMKYDQVLTKYYTQSNMMYNAITNITSYSELFDFINLRQKNNIPVPLTEQGKLNLNKAYGHLYLWSRGLEGLIGWLEVVNKEAKDLIIFIKEEYQIGR